MRLGFLGLGWIGLHRMKSVDPALVAAVADPSPQAVEAALQAAPKAAPATDLEGLLGHDLDGVVIATPSALHADQCLQALEAGVAVYCQKPLARNADEVGEVLLAARRADRLLGVDMCYRHTAAMQAVKREVEEGRTGRLYALRLAFHNAYGPDKPWFRDRRLAGGGCAMDLGIHLVDLALWLTGFPPVEGVDARLFAAGRPLEDETVEDLALARLDLAGGRTAEIACSWNLPAGCDCRLEVEAYGDCGGVLFRNLHGSFYDFEALRLQGTTAQTLAAPPDDWGGRSLRAWVDRLRTHRSFDPGAEEHRRVAEVLDAMYRRETFPCAS